jgi:hypothetical protein
MKAEERLRKIYKELAKEAQKLDREAAEKRKAAEEIEREIEEWKRSYFVTMGMEAFNPMLTLAIVTNIMREAQKQGVVNGISETEGFRENFTKLARTVEERLELYAEAKEAGVKIDPEFEKRFKEDLIDALEKTGMIDEEGEEKEKDSKLLKEVQRLKKELFRDAVERKEARHATHHEA